MKGTRTMPYNDVLDITTEYLGPAAKRFIDRHIANHLNKKPEDLTGEDLPLLTDWVRVSMALLTNDRQVIEGYVQELQSLREKCETVG